MIYNLFCGFYDYGATKLKNYFSGYFTDESIVDKCFLLTEHSIFFTGGLLAFYDQSWLWDITQTWVANLTYPICIYYYLYIVRYLVQINMLKIYQKDYQTMMSHHLMTILLLGLSFKQYHRIGTIIALSHDLTDIFLLSSKLLHYYNLQQQSKKIDTIIYIDFSIFCVLFFLTRILLNYKIIHHIVTYTQFSYVYKNNLPLDLIIMILLLHCNLLLQCFWQIKIIKFAYNLLFCSNPVDEKGQIYFKKE
jgi:hypothetical protein